MTADQYRGKRITITFPPDLYNKVEEMAKEENRSFSQQTVHLVAKQIKSMEDKESKD